MVEQQLNTREASLPYIELSSAYHLKEVEVDEEDLRIISLPPSFCITRVDNYSMGAEFGELSKCNAGLCYIVPKNFLQG